MQFHFALKKNLQVMLTVLKDSMTMLRAKQCLISVIFYFINQLKQNKRNNERPVMPFKLQTLA